ncbi:hypothetical protein LIER_43715 [Lithospermum erythrorhizon]|uniref:Uncharacterized protein n=1 Tax=Lithospermum erythrorhizon TaxID=34254 RepID=A0AAV3QQE6_LITER
MVPQTFSKPEISTRAKSILKPLEDRGQPIDQDAHPNRALCPSHMGKEIRTRTMSEGPHRLQMIPEETNPVNHNVRQDNDYRASQEAIVKFHYIKFHLKINWCYNDVFYHI